MTVTVTPSSAQPTVSATTTALDEQQARAVAGLLRCLARYGLAKTNLDDVAREAGCSRATLYRWVESKPELLHLAVTSEEARLLDLVSGAVRAAPTLPEAIVAGVVAAAAELTGHDALQFLLAHEPETVYGHLSFAEGDALMLRVADAIAPSFATWLDRESARRAADWLVRVVRTYCVTPEPALDLANEVVARAFLERFVIPGIAGSRESRTS